MPLRPGVERYVLEQEWPRLSAVVVTWNAADFVAEALTSLAVEIGDVPHELIVIDNASADDTAAVVEQVATRARVLVNPSNRGFAAAANAGLRASRAPLVLFLNPDAELLPGALAILEASLEADPRLALVAPQLVDGEGKPQSSHAAFGWPEERLAFHLRRARGPGTGRAGGESVDALPPTVPAAVASPGGVASTDFMEVNWVLGACMLCRREPLTQIGGFDERYFMYGEDMDLCYRLRRVGYVIGFCQAARVRHLGNASGEHYWRERREAAVIRSQLRFVRTHRGFVSELAFRLLAFPYYVAKLALNSVRAVLAPEPRASAHRRVALSALHVLFALASLAIERPRTMS
jgi:N-acetylglucosaminyl-diphospho-decaprenol L-rhamnosyltransferase